MPEEEEGLLVRLHTELSSLFIDRSNERRYRVHLEAIDALLGLDDRYFPDNTERITAIKQLQRRASSAEADR